MPDKALPAPMPEERFSRRAEMVAALKQDPLRKSQGTLKGLGDMVSQGEELLKAAYQYWPKDLPVLITHGTADEVCPLPLLPECAADVRTGQLSEGRRDVPERAIEEYLSWIEAHIPQK
ncbi:hypothetical protein PHLGIDRAFT_10963 [Phlebiopsis gigantea 11061_1 CR5-6]|uniref:Serine aminopeptidase S33 domain-containing protein n=1 Tax=Phlebiopsis gigantea (strain 11061_1 CR5-6) TaxID=745531 RepID=A0A0C3S4T7_PHLG1|nr:hypothetical protein PHLGIDRAFT_10963 [Phlebiopsis gigantea 11061_1 CR5-6]